MRLYLPGSVPDRVPTFYYFLANGVLNCFVWSRLASLKPVQNFQRVWAPPGMLGACFEFRAQKSLLITLLTKQGQSGGHHSLYAMQFQINRPSIVTVTDELGFFFNFR